MKPLSRPQRSGVRGNIGRGNRTGAGDVMERWATGGPRAGCASRHLTWRVQGGQQRRSSRRIHSVVVVVVSSSKGGPSGALMALMVQRGRGGVSGTATGGGVAGSLGSLVDSALSRSFWSLGIGKPSMGRAGGRTGDGWGMGNCHKVEAGVGRAAASFQAVPGVCASTGSRIGAPTS